MKKSVVVSSVALAGVLAPTAAMAAPAANGPAKSVPGPSCASLWARYVTNNGGPSLGQVNQWYPGVAALIAQIHVNDNYGYCSVN